MSPTTGATTSLAELQAMRAAQDVQNSATPGRECLIYFEVRRSDSPKHLDDTLGTGCLTLLETVSMLELQQRLVLEVNSRWVRTYSMPLLWDSETALRVPINVSLTQQSLSLTIKEWFVQHSTPALRDTFIVLRKNVQQGNKGTKKRKVSTPGQAVVAFPLELFVHIDTYLNRTKDTRLTQETAARAGSKRKTSGTSVAQEGGAEPAEKRP
ncbi:hypothetical protein OH76DRAFT_1490371 [Lentinus brumalis]|uniref:Uncharacterized protein n=1 Tax=Lentinus brumalis TaxID=2498619 RepID=A0A371CJ61_9APHY|nr:hypothetical protein OH76DRAFT_1490371 [Polyporus brumalis]